MMAVVIVLLCAAVVFAVYAFLLILPKKHGNYAPCLLCDYAHRGLHGNGVPENSLAAFEIAVNNGFGIELDVQLTKDGTVVVFHDYTLKRMTEVEKKLSELDLCDLQTLSLAGTDQKIPTFEQVLTLVNGKVPILVELKGESLDTSLCEKTAELLKQYHGAYCIESFNPLLIKEIKKYLPDAFCGLLYTNVCREKKKNSLLNILLSIMAFNIISRPNFIAYNKADRRSVPVKLVCGIYGIPRFVWTVKGDEELAAAHRSGEYPIFEK